MVAEESEGTSAPVGKVKMGKSVLSISKDEAPEALGWIHLG